MTGGEGQACNEGDTCNASFCNPLECVEGTCVAGEAPCPENQTCSEEGEGACLCTDDASCDDGDACTTDTCDADTGACTNAAVECPEGQECDATSGECVDSACTSDEDCEDDGDNCTAETCNLDTGECETNPVECPAGFECDADTGECVASGCEGAEDCDDENACTENTCVNNVCVFVEVECEDDGDACTTEECNAESGECESTPVECPEGQSCDAETGECVEDTSTACTSDDDCEDDGLFCNGTESCVIADGETEGTCESSGDPCEATGQDCDEDADECTGGTACTSDADCADDGIFCNGTESCDTDAGVCVSSGDPCEEGETCSEDLNECQAPMGETIDFTLGNDDLSGTGGDDTFSGLLEFNAPTGTNVPTVSSADRANGGDGTDTINIQFNEPNANTTVAPTLTSIEVYNVEDQGATGGNATTLSLANATGITTINSLNSLDDALTVNNVDAVPNFGITNTASDFLVTLIAPATNGNSDESTLTLDRAKVGCTATITTPVNGLETLNVVSGGSSDNVLDALTQNTGTTLTTLNVSGGAHLTVTAALNTQLTTINCGDSMGGTDLLVGGTQNITYTGGDGDDAINFAGSYSTSDMIDGGGGTNTLGVNSTQAVAATTSQTNVMNIATLRIPDQLNGNVDVNQFGATNVTLDTTAAATALTAGASVVTLGSGSPTALLNNDDTAHTLGLTVTGPGTDDALAVNCSNADLGNTLTATGAETVNLTSSNGSDGTAADGNANTGTAITLTPTFGTGTLNVSGDVAFTLTGAVTAGIIDASGLNAAFTMGAATGVASTITGSGQNDTLFGSNNGDSISGGDGNDKCVGGQGGDNITGGSGSDTYQYTNAADGGAADADNVGMDLIQGFVVGTGNDILGFQDDIFFDNNDTLDLDIITGAAAGNVVTGLTDGGGTAAQVVVQTTALTDFAAAATLFTTINGVITSADVILIAEVTNQGTFVFWDGDTTVANGERVLAQLVGLSASDIAGIVAANIAINDG